MSDSRPEAQMIRPADLDENPNQRDSLQGLDLAEYTNDDQPLPLLIPSALPPQSVLARKASDKSSHPLKGLGVLEYHPYPKKAYVPFTPASLKRLLSSYHALPPRPPLPPSRSTSMPDWMPVSPDTQGLDRILRKTTLPSFSKSDLEFASTMLQYYNRIRSNKQRRDRDLTKAIEALFESPQDIDDLVREASNVAGPFDNGDQARAEAQKPTSKKRKKKKKTSSKSKMKQENIPVESDRIDESKDRKGDKKQQHGKERNAQNKKKCTKQGNVVELQTDAKQGEPASDRTDTVKTDEKDVIASKMSSSSKHRPG